jgi:hypothetical protein
MTSARVVRWCMLWTVASTMIGVGAVHAGMFSWSNFTGD